MQLNASKSFDFDGTFSCLRCNKVDKMRYKDTEMWICPSCKSVFNVTWAEGENLKLVAANRMFNLILSKRTESDDFKKQLVRLGDKLILKGENYEVIGVVCKTNNSGDYWLEYQLYHSVYPYRFLICYQNHWSIFYSIDTNKDLIKRNSNIIWLRELEYLNKTYKKYERYKADIVDGAGECSENCKDLANVTCVDFIGPPQIITLEQKGKELEGFLGEAISPSELMKTLPADRPFLKPYGIGVLDVPAFGVKPKFIALLSLLAFLVILGLQCTFYDYSKTTSYYANDSVSNLTYTRNTQDSKISDLIVSEPFKFNDNADRNVYLNISVPQLNNSWFECAGYLLNENTGQKYYFNDNAEFYQGVEDGESWTEGKNMMEVYIHSIPSGTYRLAYEFQFESKVTGYYVVLLYRNYPQWHSFYLMSFLIWLSPVFLAIYCYYFEVRRWKESDFSPYASKN